jgi:glutathione S-transferase
MIQLYHYPSTRADRPLWMLEEMEIPFEVIRVDLAVAANEDPHYLEIHPHGRVPAMVDGELILIESGAICTYLADTYLEKALAPPPGTPSRPHFYQWMFYCVATLDPPAYEIVLQRKLLPEKMRSQSRLKEAENKFAEAAAFLDHTLSDRAYILGETFTAADIMLGMTLMWNKSLLAPYRNLEGYVKRLAARPALKRMREKYR